MTTMMTISTKDLKFTYDRKNAPLFICENEGISDDRFRMLKKEFRQRVRSAPDLHEKVPMSNGMSLGEFAMYAISFRKPIK